MKVYLSEEQYKQLLADGSITVGNTTVIYNEDDDYLTPVDEYVTIDGYQTINGNKTFTGPMSQTINYGTNISGDNIIIQDFSSSCYNWMSPTVVALGVNTTNSLTQYRNSDIQLLESGVTTTLNLPKKGGTHTIATTEDIPKLYRHIIRFGSYDVYGYVGQIAFTRTTAEKITLDNTHLISHKLAVVYGEGGDSMAICECGFEPWDDGNNGVTIKIYGNFVNINNEIANCVYGAVAYEGSFDDLPYTVQESDLI